MFYIHNRNGREKVENYWHLLCDFSVFDKLYINFPCIWVTSLKKSRLTCSDNSMSLDETSTGMWYTWTCLLMGLSVNVVKLSLFLWFSMFSNNIC
jgi:hypothetical protein